MGTCYAMKGGKPFCKYHIDGGESIMGHLFQWAVTSLKCCKQPRFSQAF